MANNYTQTSFVFACGTEANAKRVCGWLNREPGFPDDLVERLTNEGMEWDEEDAVVEGGSIDFVEKVPAYDIADASIEPDDKTQVWVHIDEGGDLAALTTVLDYAMQTMPEIPSPQGYTWAETCSKMRVDEFSGGASLVVRGKAPVWMGSSRWLGIEFDKLTATENTDG